VLFGCCTNLLEFYRRIGVEKNIRWYETMTFVEPGGRSSVLERSFLPAPLHTTLSFLSFPFFGCVRQVGDLACHGRLDSGASRDTGESFLDWLHRHNQTHNAIERFWKPVLVSALSEDLELVSVAYAGQVVRESMKSKKGEEMGIPTIPLSELYASAADYNIRARRIDRYRRASSHFTRSRRSWCDRTEKNRNSIPWVLAVPFDVLARILPETAAAAPLAAMLGSFRHRRLRGFICGLTARSAIWIMPCCSIEPSSGCFTSRASSQRARTKLGRTPTGAMWNWW